MKNARTSSRPRMSRIELVMHLQSVDLFRSCAATEAVRLAQIAEPLRMLEGEVLYRPTEPASALYSVVEGRVLLEGGSGERRHVGPCSAFGVRDVLSGRQRSDSAEAREDSLIVAIEGEDLFDLLSNNIDIVKALFREILEEPDRVTDTAVSTEPATRATREPDAAPAGGDTSELDQGELDQLVSAGASP